MLYLADAHSAHCLLCDDFVVHASSAIRRFGLSLLPSINTAEAAVIVVTEPLEIIEYSHFEIGTRERRGKFFANRVENSNAALFFDTLGQQLLGARSTFLRCRLVVGNTRMHAAFLIEAHVEEGAGVAAVDDDGGFGLRVLRFLHIAVLSLIQDIRFAALSLPCWSLRKAQRFFAFFFERLDANLDQRFHLHAVAARVGADGFPLHLWKEHRVIARPFRAARATSGGGQQRFILRVEGRMAQVQEDFAFDPGAEFTHGDGFGFPVFQG